MKTSKDYFDKLQQVYNIKSEQLTECLGAGPQEEILIKIRATVIKGISETYAGVRSNTPLALIGSRGYLEIAVNQGSAAHHLNAEKGESVWVVSE